jgi:hypothetical protein
MAGTGPLDQLDRPRTSDTNDRADGGPEAFEAGEFVRRALRPMGVGPQEALAHDRAALLDADQAARPPLEDRTPFVGSPSFMAGSAQPFRMGLIFRAMIQPRSAL